MNNIGAFVRHLTKLRQEHTKIFSNITWLIFDKVIRLGLHFFITVWIARYLGVDQFGLLSFAMACVGIFSSIATLGLNGIVVRDLVQNPGDSNKTLGSAAALLLFGGILSYFSVVALIVLLRPEDNFSHLLVLILGSSLLTKSSDIAVYWFESQISSKYVVWVQNFFLVFFALIKMALILSNASIEAFCWAFAAEAFLIGFTLIITFNFRGIRLKFLNFSFVRAKSLLSDSWPLMLAGVAIVIYMKIDQIMLGEILSDNDVGIYSVAVRISEIFYLIPTVIVASVFPYIIKYKNINYELYKRNFQRLYDILVLLSLIIVFPVTFYSEDIVSIVFGPAYLESSDVLMIHIWAATFVFIGVASGQWLVAEGQQILSLQRALFGMIINILLNLVLIPSFGGMGAAVATLISQVFAALLFDAFQLKTKIMFLMKLRSFNIFSSCQRLMKFN